MKEAKSKNLSSNYNKSAMVTKMHELSRFRKLIAAIALLAFSSIFGSNAFAGLTSLDISDPARQFYNPANGHIYEFVTGFVDWNTARDAAVAKSIAGVSGHLVTITSQSENDFIFSLVPAQWAAHYYQYYWIGASDAASEGDWFWMTGPEAGTQFATSGGLVSVNGMFNALLIAGGPPASVEDYAILEPFANGWGDLSIIDGGVPTGYLVEYSVVSTSASTPSLLVLLGCCLVYVPLARRRSLFVRRPPGFE